MSEAGVLTRKFAVTLYAWACRRLYHEFAWSYDWVSWLVSLGRWTSWRRIALDHLAGGRVLEIGFGTGELLLDLARRDDIAAYGLELSPAMQRITAAKLRRNGLVAPRVEARAQAMPFADGGFDAIVSTFPAEYIVQADTLHEIVRLLRPPQAATGQRGGRLIVVGLWVAFESAWLRRLAPIFYGGPSQEFLVKLRERMEAAGLAAVFGETQIGRACVGIITAERT